MRCNAVVPHSKLCNGHVHLSCVVVGHSKNHQKQFFAINQPINDISLPNFQGIYKTIFKSNTVTIEKLKFYE